MKRIAILFTVVFSFASCSSPAENSTTNSNAANLNSNSVIASTANSKLIPLEGVDPDKFNANTSNVPLANRAPTNQTSTVGPRSAPDNSELNTTMRPDGSVAETRTFKDHPELSKVERITNGSKVTVKVYLRSGKVIDVPNEKIPEFHVIAPGNILSAAGIKPAALQPKNDGKNGEAENEKVEKPN